MSATDPASPTFSRWLAHDFIEFNEVEAFDLVIIGSGYGAAMAAVTFAGCTGPDGQTLRVALLERGCEVLPGGFPSTLDELPGRVRISRAGQPPVGRRDALFDLRLAGDVSALVANGLGGGSLINGGVMVEPRWGSFDSRLPANVEADLHATWIPESKRLLGAEVPDGAGAWVANTINRHPQVSVDKPLPKTAALKSLTSANPQGEFPSAIPVLHEPAAITVRLAAQDNEHQAVALNACSLCGDCLTGCNVGAKASLDGNLLVDAQRQGLKIYTSASVLELTRDGGLWSLTVVHTNPQVQSRRPEVKDRTPNEPRTEPRNEPVRVRARKVVLAAGSLGSTEILLRSQRSNGPKAPKFSLRLGEQFSLNGDNTAFIGFPNDVNAQADENLPLTGDDGVSPRRVGPEITHMIEWPADEKGPGFLLQEFSVPAPLRGMFQDIVTTRSWLDRLAAGDFQSHRTATPNEADPLAIDKTAMKRVLMVGLIGHDSASGRIKLPETSPDEGSVRVTWQGVGQDAAMAAAFQKLELRVRARLGKQAHLTPNPIWQPVPEALTGVVGGGAFTVHPLGGCAMADNVARGVVNEWGAVFNTAPDASDNWEESLLVLDGSVVPASLGANPALTIAALSLRAARHWREAWKWTPPPSPTRTPAPKPRPRARALEACLPPPTRPTKVQIIERLSGIVNRLGGPEGPERRVVELTFGFESQSVHALTEKLQKCLPLERGPGLRNAFPGVNTLRIYKASVWESQSLDLMNDRHRDHHAEVVAHLDGHMNLLVREPTHWAWRIFRAGLGYLRNRGLRDMARAPQFAPSAIMEILSSVILIASQAGEVRSFQYRMRVREVKAARGGTDQTFWEQALLNADIRGDKRFTYACGENPWNQLLYLNLRRLGQGLLPHPWWAWRKAPQLKLDARFLARQGVPLLRITDQANQVRALADLAHLGMYWARMFIKLHLWHLRAPDAPSNRTLQRLPGAVTGLPPPEITEIDLEPLATLRGKTHKRAVVRLTRYRGRSAEAGREPKAPLVFIHGYSASGTSFAHDAVPLNAALHFWKAGRDVWLLDLRTSIGMPTASSTWAFEDAAWADIPVAINHIAEKVSHERGGRRTQVDVFAHCIGAVMLSMALLHEPTTAAVDPEKPTRYPDELHQLPHNIRKLVLSQKGFAVEYTDANILRSYLLRFFKGSLEGGYSFRPPVVPRARDTLFDSFLNTLPYPPDEWPRENPLFGRVPWGATRRRMDALYERTFNIKRMSPKVLEHIDDFFGALNLETLAQVIHFAQHGVATDRKGRPLRLSRLEYWPRNGTLLLSSRDNGLVNPHTSLTMEAMLKSKGVPGVQRALLEGGHQDLLIGSAALKTWQAVEGFLDV